LHLHPSAGLAHELNNPAAAVSRGASHLEEISSRFASVLKLNRQQMTATFSDLQRDTHSALKI